MNRTKKQRTTPRSVRPKPVTATLFMFSLIACGCDREQRTFRPSPPFDVVVSFQQEYQENAYSLSEGKRLFTAYNCKDCHANGGGAIGPPLMDSAWIYGYKPEQIFETISKGRPNGMPSFGQRVADHQIWQLAAYVRSLSGHAPLDAAPGRSDHMQTAPPENSREPATPVIAPPANAGDKR